MDVVNFLLLLYGTPHDKFGKGLLAGAIKDITALIALNYLNTGDTYVGVFGLGRSSPRLKDTVRPYAC